MYSVEKIFLVTLSSKIPLPVSSTASLASSIWADRPAKAISLVILLICSWSNFMYSSRATLALATRLSTIVLISAFFSSSVISTVVTAFSFFSLIGKTPPDLLFLDKNKPNKITSTPKMKELILSNLLQDA